MIADTTTGRPTSRSQRVTDHGFLAERVAIQQLDVTREGAAGRVDDRALGRFTGQPAIFGTRTPLRGEFFGDRFSYMGTDDFLELVE